MALPPHDDGRVRNGSDISPRRRGPQWLYRTSGKRRIRDRRIGWQDADAERVRNGFNSARQQ